MRYYRDLTSYKEEHERYKHNQLFYAFDIETTKGLQGSYMYCCQFDFYNEKIGHNSIILRTWDEFSELLQYLATFNIKVAIHNLSYEWAFISHRYKMHITKVFAVEKRKVVYFDLFNIRFFDTYILTGMSLKQLAKTYTSLEKGIFNNESILDYEQKRNSLTPLTDTEKLYCYLDVEILTEYQQTMFNSGFDTLPLTKTGFIRNRIKKACKARDNYQAIIKSNFPDENLYKFMMRYVYCGGWCSAPVRYIGKTLKSTDTQSVDKKSSYPWSCFKKLPWRFRKSRNFAADIEYTIQDIENRAFMGIFRLKVENKLGYTIFSKHKAIWYDRNTQFINGRLWSGEITLALTELDYITLHRFYNVTSETCLQLYLSKKDHLPIEILTVIKDCFVTKNNTPKSDALYHLNKADLNSIYGYFVQSLFNSELEFNNESGSINEVKENVIEWWKLVQKQYTLPQWGVWVSATSRYDMLTLLYEIITKTDGKAFNVYSDTDSMKIVNYTIAKPIIDDYNIKCLEYIRSIEKKFNFNIGDLGALGTYENETEEHGGIEKFKTLGCKRYLYQCLDGHIEVAVAGLPKRSFIETCHQNKTYNYFKMFDFGFKANKDNSHKLASEYIDEPVSESITDIYGNTETMQEYSCVNLFPIEFEIKKDLDFITIIRMFNRRSRVASTY